MANYVQVERGQLNTTDYRLFIKDTQTDTFVSPFHDIPLLHDREKNIFNVLIEIPRWSNAKMEINKKDTLNPISQDVKNGKLRFVNNIFPFHGYMWNYGAFPQTWEDPNVKDTTTGCNGDNDPLDVCEIGSKIHARGSVIQVKVLGALGLIDEGEADWKIIAIDVTDPMAEKLNNIYDVEKNFTGLLDATRSWFKNYKIPTGKPANNFASNGKFFDQEFALEQIEHDHKLWANLVNGDYDCQPEKKKGISLINTSVEKSGEMKIEAQEASKKVEETSKPFNAEPAHVEKLPIDTVYYVSNL